VSIKEILQAIHDLTNQFQVVLSAIELAEMESMKPEVRRNLRIARVEMKRAMHTMRQIQSLGRILEEEERESKQ
jgi:hypothetical protein